MSRLRPARVMSCSAERKEATFHIIDIIITIQLIIQIVLTLINNYVNIVVESDTYEVIENEIPIESNPSVLCRIRISYDLSQEV